MSHILLTGMTAPQASPTANERTFSFAAAVNQTLIDAGHTVTWLDPKLSWTKGGMTKFDAILIGVAPLTGLGANRAYGALHLIDMLWDDPRLRLFIDAPKPHQITAALKAVHTKPENLVKDFYSYRQEFASAKEEDTLARLLRAVERLSNDPWPTTIHPSLPWRGDSLPTISRLPLGVSDDNFFGVNLDTHVLSAVPLDLEGNRVANWVTDDPKSPWILKTATGLNCPVLPMKHNKGWTDEQVQAGIQSSLGVLLAPHKPGGLWWSHRIIQALVTQTPIATEWRETEVLGWSWSLLASQIEEMTDAERAQVANEQLRTYLEAAPTWVEAMRQLEAALGLAESE